MKRISILMALVIVLALAGTALAMSSSHYALNWYTPMTGSGGSAASAHYAVNFTVGQSAIGTYSGQHNSACLGYWCGVAEEQQQHFYLPLVSNRYH